MDFSQTTTEIVRDKYAENFFINAGMTCRLSKRMLLELAALNVLNRKVYAESFYNGASYSYYQIPLRGKRIYSRNPISILMFFLGNRGKSFLLWSDMRINGTPEENVPGLQIEYNRAARS